MIELLIFLFLLLGILILNACLCGFETSIVGIRRDLELRGELEALLRSDSNRIAGGIDTAAFARHAAYALLGVIVVVFLSISQGEELTKGIPITWVIGFASISGFVVLELLGIPWARLQARRAPIVTAKRFWPVSLIVHYLLMPIRVPQSRVHSWLESKLTVESKEQTESLDTSLILASISHDSDSVSEVVGKIISNAVALSDLEVYDVNLPRSQVKIFDINASNEENLKLARETGHTRFPLCDGDLDKCLGIIHIKDIFRFRGDPLRINFDRIKRNIITVHQGTRIEDALQRILKHRAHMALVSDDFGGVRGVITLERILEELVGDIQDEFDVEEKLVTQLGEKLFRVSGLTPIHDLEEEFGVEIENEDVSTFGGLITQEVGKIPEAGYKMSYPGMEIIVTEVDGTRVLYGEVILVDASHKEVDDS